jgi:transposase
VLARRRQWDRARRERREHHRRTQREFRFRVKVVRHFHRLRGQGESEQWVVELSWDKYRPGQEGDLRLSQSTIRNWVRQVKRAQGNYSVLRPKSRRPRTIKLRIPAQVIKIIFTLRHQLGWGGHRIAAELKERDVAQISDQAVCNIFERLGLPVKIYVLKAKSESIAYRKYEKKRPNAQWHIDRIFSITGG